MNMLLINMPSRKGYAGFMIPMGLLYVGGIVERCGHKARISDPYLDDFELKDFDSGEFNNIYKEIEAFKPSIIGYGGIATSFGRMKRLSAAIKMRYPDILQIAGGALASTSELILTKTAVSAVFHGETEVSLPEFLGGFSDHEDYSALPGISFLSEGKVVTNQPAKQIEDLDTIPFPAYHLVDLKKYLHSIDSWIALYKVLLSENPHYGDILKNIGKKKAYIPVITSRGCTHKCFFCYRHFQGIRRHSVEYAINHVKYLKEIYGVEGFQFSDELFNSDPEWVTAFCDAIEKERLDIFYLIGGARIDKVNENMLRLLKRTGCIEINYGHESGSDLILKEYRKGVTARMNKEITLLTSRDIGLSCPVQLVIGSPSENPSTIRETIRFLKDVEAYQYSLNYLIPLPGTPSWQYVQDKKLIPDTEQYLDRVADKGGVASVNLTNVPDRIWRRWTLLISKELKLHLRKKTNPRTYFFYAIFYNTVYFLHNIYAFIPERHRKILRKYIWSKIPEENLLRKYKRVKN